jgi:hypothetical protein
MRHVLCIMKALREAGGVGSLVDQFSAKHSNCRRHNLTGNDGAMMS